MNAPLWVLPDPGHCTEPGVSSQAPNLWSVVTESSERQSPKGAGYIRPCTSSLPSPCFWHWIPGWGWGLAHRDQLQLSPVESHVKKEEILVSLGSVLQEDVWQSLKSVSRSGTGGEEHQLWSQETWVWNPRSAIYEPSELLIINKN